MQPLQPPQQQPIDYLRRGSISIESSPPGAYIFIDGYQFADYSDNPILTPATMTEVPGGYHEIYIILHGYHSKRFDIYITPGKINNIFAELIPI